MKKTLTLIILTIVINLNCFCQTPGFLSFSVTPTSTGAFSPSHVLAVWIEDSSGVFVKTKIKYGNWFYFFLVNWYNVSGGNVVDAITGPTQFEYTTYEGVWNGTDINGNYVTDGQYKLQFELSWGNNSSLERATYTINFTKGHTDDHQTGSSANFPSIIVNWKASGIGFNEYEAENSQIKIYPNPVNSYSVIDYFVSEQDLVNITIYNSKGQIVKTLINEWQPKGNHTLIWNGQDDNKHVVSNGLYMITLKIANKQYTKTVFLNK